MPATICLATLPTGTVTFLFTDIEGSTKLWEAHPDTMRVAHMPLAKAFTGNRVNYDRLSETPIACKFPAFCNSTAPLMAFLNFRLGSIAPDIDRHATRQLCNRQQSFSRGPAYPR